MIYDNDFGTDWEIVMNTVYDWIKQNSASVAIIDNLMALDLPTGALDKYDMQTRIVKRFSAMAKELNIHLHFICHPRKTEAFLRKGDITMSDLKGLPPQHAWSERIAQVSMHEFTPVDEAELPEEWRTQPCTVV